MEERRVKKRPPQNKKGSSTQKRFKPLTIVGIVLAVLVAICIAQEVKNYWDLKVQEKALQQEIQELREKNEKLEKEKESLAKPEAIEKVARDELGLVKPGEVPYVK